MLLTISIPLFIGSVIGVILSVRYIMANSGSSFDAAAFSEELNLWVVQHEMLLTLVSSAMCLVPFLPMWSSTKKQTPLYANYGNLTTKLICLVMAFTGFNLLLSLLISITGLTERFSYDVVTRILTTGNVIVRA